MKFFAFAAAAMAAENKETAKEFTCPADAVTVLADWGKEKTNLTTKLNAVNPDEAATLEAAKKEAGAACASYVKLANCQVVALEKALESATENTKAAADTKPVVTVEEEKKDKVVVPADQEPVVNQEPVQERRNLKAETVSQLDVVKTLCKTETTDLNAKLELVEECKGLCDKISFGYKAAAFVPLFLIALGM